MWESADILKLIGFRDYQGVSCKKDSGIVHINYKIMIKNKVRFKDDYAEIVITRKSGEECVFKVDTEDLPLLTKKQWVVQWNSSNKGYGKYYAICNTKTKEGKHTTLKMHQLLCPTLPHEVVDHINRDTQDNRKSNLRAISTRENSCNSDYSKGKIPIKGVYSRHPNKFYAAINCGDKICQTKQYNSIEEASFARYVLVNICYPLVPPNTDESWRGKLSAKQMKIIYKDVITKFSKFIIL